MYIYVHIAPLVEANNTQNSDCREARRPFEYNFRPYAFELYIYIYMIVLELCLRARGSRYTYTARNALSVLGLMDMFSRRSGRVVVVGIALYRSMTKRASERDF